MGGRGKLAASPVPFTQISQSECGRDLKTDDDGPPVAAGEARMHTRTAAAECFKKYET